MDLISAIFSAFRSDETSPHLLMSPEPSLNYLSWRALTCRKHQKVFLASGCLNCRMV